MKYKTPLVVLGAIFVLVIASFYNVSPKNINLHIESSPGPIAKIASGANGDLAWPGAGLSGSFQVNISLSSGFVPAGTLIAVYGATGHDNFPASMTVTDSGGTIYFGTTTSVYLLPQGFPSAPPEHVALRQAWLGVTTTSVSNVFITSSANSSNHMWYLWGAANAYINANTVVAMPLKVNISAQDYIASFVTTKSNSWIFWGAFVLLESATPACPQNGYNTGNVSGGSTQNTYITSNNTLGETQVPFKYADRCVTPDLGIAVFDTHGPIPAPVTTFHWMIHQYAAFNNLFMIALEIKWVSAPPVVDDLPATNVGVNTATINGALNSLGDDVNVTVGFLWSTNSSVPKLTSNNITMGSKTVIGNFSRQLFGLSSNVTYYYRVWAIFSEGYVSSGITNFTTAKFQPFPQNVIFGFILLIFVTFMILFFMFVFWVRRRRGMIQ